MQGDGVKVGQKVSRRVRGSVFWGVFFLGEETFWNIRALIPEPRVSPI